MKIIAPKKNLDTMDVKTTACFWYPFIILLLVAA